MRDFVFILMCLPKNVQVVVLTKVPGPMCHASTCMAVFNHVSSVALLQIIWRIKCFTVFLFAENIIKIKNMKKHIQTGLVQRYSLKNKQKDQPKFLKAVNFVKLLDSHKHARSASISIIRPVNSMQKVTTRA